MQTLDTTPKQTHRFYNSTVFITHESPRNRDFSSADKYGRLEFILSQNDRPSITPGDCYIKILSCLEKYQPQDFIINAGGDPLAPILLGYALAKLQLPKVKFLRWNKRRREDGSYSPTEGYYVPVEFNPVG